MRNYKDLKVWAKAHQLTLQVYLSTKKFPKDEIYGLTSQIRRSCISIEANLAEGCGRGSDGEMARFVHIAMGSASELDCHLLLARDLEILSPRNYEQFENLSSETRRMLSALLQAIQGKQKSSSAVAG